MTNTLLVTYLFSPLQLSYYYIIYNLQNARALADGGSSQSLYSELLKEYGQGLISNEILNKLLRIILNIFLLNFFIVVSLYFFSINNSVLTLTPSTVFLYFLSLSFNTVSLIIFRIYEVFTNVASSRKLEFISLTSNQLTLMILLITATGFEVVIIAHVVQSVVNLFLIIWISKSGLIDFKKVRIIPSFRFPNLFQIKNKVTFFFVFFLGGGSLYWLTYFIEKEDLGKVGVVFAAIGVIMNFSRQPIIISRKKLATLLKNGKLRPQFYLRYYVFSFVIFGLGSLFFFFGIGNVPFLESKLRFDLLEEIFFVFALPHLIFWFAHWHRLFLDEKNLVFLFLYLASLIVYASFSFTPWLLTAPVLVFLLSCFANLKTIINYGKQNPSIDRMQVG